MQGNNNNLVGRTLGTCRLEKLIGRGGMGEVYLAQQERPSRRVAVKVLRPDLSERDTEGTQQFLARFRREANVIARLEHLNIIPIYEYDEQDNLAYLVMPYLTGGSLSDRLAKRGALSLDEAIRYIDQAASALDYAHAQGVIHRDLKPANFLLHADGRLILTDFGIARLIEDSTPGTTLTTTGMVMGTPDYMAPEMANGASVDYRVDTYELGVVLYTLLTGHVPFRGSSPLIVLTKHLSEPLPHIHQQNPQIPSTIDAVIQKATAKQPGARYASLHEMSQELHAALSPSPSPATVYDQQLTIPDVSQRQPQQPQQIQQPVLPVVLDNTETAASPQYEPQRNTPPGPYLPQAPNPQPYYPTSYASPVSLARPTPPPTPPARRRNTGLLILIALLACALIAGSIFTVVQLTQPKLGSRTTTGGITATQKTTPTPVTTSTPVPQTGNRLYTTSTPGVGCDNGGATWAIYAAVNVVCQNGQTLLTNTDQNLILQGIFLTALPGQAPYPSNYVVEARLQVQQGATGRFGLYIRNQPGNLKGTYTFLVGPDGAWSISVYDNFTGLPKHLTGGHIHALQDKIKLAAVVVGSYITVYVNGQKLGSVKDKTYNSGTVGIVLDQGASVTVNRFSLYNPA